jgi:hypothetical protein
MSKMFPNRKKPSNTEKDLTILKIRGVSQYVLYVGSNEVNFIDEEDAQRFASHITGRLKHPIQEV